VDAFPAPTAALLRAAYDGGETTSQEYRTASREFWRRHVCRIPFPPDVQRAVDDTSVAVLETMWGPDDVVLRGNLAGWDVSDRIDAISVPTLITVGKHDALTPTSARMIADRIAGSELVVFDKSSHHAHWEERERHMGVVRDFLQAH
jgi:proline-specific peptidase